MYCHVNAVNMFIINNLYNFSSCAVVVRTFAQRVTLRNTLRYYVYLIDVNKELTTKVSKRDKHYPKRTTEEAQNLP